MTMKFKQKKGRKVADWVGSENAALVALYFIMLDSAMAGRSYSKAAMIRTAQTGPLAARSKGSVEAKIMNCSAAHRDLSGMITMDGYGYRCLENYQAGLREAVRVELASRDIVQKRGGRYAGVRDQIEQTM